MLQFPLRPFCAPNRWLVPCFLTVGCLPLAATSAQAELRAVAVTGRQVPGMAQGTSFASVRLAGLNELGQTAMIAELSSDASGTPMSAGSAVFVEQAGTFRIVARQGDSAPGAPDGFAFDAFPFALINDVGQVAFVANYSLDGSGYIDVPGLTSLGYGVWSEAGGLLQPAALFSEPMPGATEPNLSLKKIREFSIPAFNKSGHTAFAGANQPAIVRDCFILPCHAGVWIERDDVLSKVAIEGDAAPTLNSEFSGFEFYTDFSFSYADVAVALNDQGETAFLAIAGNGEGLWSTAGGSLGPVILEGAPAPGMPTGTNFASASAFFAPAINNAGQVAGRWDLTKGGGITEMNDTAIWSGRPGEVRLVAREGDLAPGTIESFSILGDPVVNRVGDTAFHAEVGPIPFGEFSPAVSGIWVERNGQLVPIAVTGEAAPGTPEGTAFNTVGGPLLNAAGQIAFGATLQLAGGVTEDNNAGIWALNSVGELQLIFREGDAIDVDNGSSVDLRVVSSLSNFSDVIFAGQGSGNEDGRPSFFSDRGELAFYAEFTDGTSGIFVSDVVSIPEPTSIVLAVSIVAGGALGHGRRVTREEPLTRTRPLNARSTAWR